MPSRSPSVNSFSHSPQPPPPDPGPLAWHALDVVRDLQGVIEGLAELPDLAAAAGFRLSPDDEEPAWYRDARGHLDDALAPLLRLFQRYDTHERRPGPLSSPPAPSQADPPTQTPLMVYEVVDGRPMPRLPVAADGSRVEPDGHRYLSVQQAAERFGVAERRLRDNWLATWSGIYPAGEAAAAEGGVSHA